MMASFRRLQKGSHIATPVILSSVMITRVSVIERWNSNMDTNSCVLNKSEYDVGLKIMLETLMLS